MALMQERSGLVWWLLRGLERVHVAMLEFKHGHEQQGTGRQQC